MTSERKDRVAEVRADRTSWHGRRPPEEDHIVVAAWRERDEARAEVERLRARLGHSVCATCGKADALFCSSAYHLEAEA